MKCLKVELVIPLCYQGACAPVLSSEHKGRWCSTLSVAGFCLHVFKLTAAQGMSFVSVALFESGVPVGSQCMLCIHWETISSNLGNSIKWNALYCQQCARCSGCLYLSWVPLNGTFYHWKILLFGFMVIAGQVDLKSWYSSIERGIKIIFLLWRAIKKFKFFKFQKFSHLF